MKPRLRLFVVLNLVLLSFACAAPDEEADDDNDTADDDDNNDNDDSSPADDDNNDDNDTGDDDDDNDDDDDDDDDNDNNDDNNDNNDTVAVRDDIALLDGGTTGWFGFSVRPAPDGTLYVGTTQGGFIFVYRFLDGAPVTGVPLFATYRMVMDIDGAGHLHFLFADPDDALWYATNASGQWVRSAVAGECDVDKKVDLAIDANGKAHAVYQTYEFTNHQIHYATNTSGNWSSLVVDGTNDVLDNGGPSIALDEDGHAFVVYDSGWDDYWLADNASGTWTKRSISCAGGWWYSDLALDHAGNIHAAFRNGSEQLVHAVSPTGDAWTCETVGPGGRVPEIVIDADDYVHVSSYSYGSAASQMLVYSTNKSGAWESSNVAPQSSVSPSYYFTGLGLDAEGVPHVAYYDSSPDTLLRADPVEDAWEINEVATGGRIRFGTAFELDTAGQPNIACGNNQLTLLRWSGTAWQYERLETVSDRFDLKIDSEGHRHLVLQGGDDLTLNYLTDKSGEWAEEVVDYRYCETPKLALDAGGNAHLVYACVDLPPYSGPYYLIYATNAGDGWTIEDMGISMDAAYGVEIAVIGGQVRVYYSSKTELSEAVKDGGDWVTTPLTTGSYLIVDDLVVDVDQHPHIALLDWWEDQARHVTDASGVWTVEPIYNGTPVDLALAFDPWGRLHAAFWDSRLYHAVKTGEAWTSEILWDEYLGWTDIDLGIDSTGRAHVSFLGNEAQWYATFQVEP